MPPDKSCSRPVGRAQAQAIALDTQRRANDANKKKTARKLDDAIDSAVAKHGNGLLPA